MKYLTVFVEKQNRYRKFFNQPVMLLSQMNDEMAQELFQLIDTQLSPESLTCDGELKRGAIKAKLKELNGALKEIKSLGYSPKEVVYNF